MKKKIAPILSLAFMIVLSSCGNSGNTGAVTEKAIASPAQNAAQEPAAYDPKRGEGKFDETNVKLEAPDAARAGQGKAIAQTKCFSCHKTTTEKLVGPGWKGVTERRAPHWILNFITNPDPMIDKDPQVQAQLELCLVRMPNQNLSEDEARSILEFMRQNDGAK
ncbi:cytochrome c [Niabella sp. CC-SYL272]|uniref:c-type cytochrome n=1 Tax=Niabella agricola TaxID=2891571 RepID=UPI001F263FB6|nr:c-type cytochrome [Niabella agricola]MCF3108980.1 cytochrome c [Niabella agricola]